MEYIPNYSGIAALSRLSIKQYSVFGIVACNTTTVQRFSMLPDDSRNRFSYTTFQLRRQPPFRFQSKLCWNEIMSLFRFIPGIPASGAEWLEYIPSISEYK